MQATSDFLGTEPVGRLTLRLAIPAVTAQLVNMLYNLVDRMYIGHIADIGSLALTGVGRLRAADPAHRRVRRACLYGRCAARVDADGQG